MKKSRMAWEDGYQAAMIFKGLLMPWCVRAVIAGSIRRRKLEVADIELVAEPSFSETMFGDSDENLLVNFLADLAAAKAIRPRKNKNGHNIAWFQRGQPCRYVAMWWDKYPVDLFMVLPDRRQWWGYTLWLRTGPGDANRFMVSQPPSGMCPQDVAMAKGRVILGGNPFPVPDERTMFRVLKLMSVEPHYRSVERYKVARRSWIKSNS